MRVYDSVRFQPRGVGTLSPTERTTLFGVFVAWMLLNQYSELLKRVDLWLFNLFLLHGLHCPPKGLAASRDMS